MAFRKDINGLRAIAVIAVVLFHFNPSWVSGGFAGVDVFFVISGFLMTGIIFRGIEKKDLSLLRFYIARANRIIPALAVLCLSLLIFGWFYLTPLDYKVLGKHVAGSIGFISNILYWRESGYFDAASQEKWLLHTWSLSVEWQFYIVYPLVLLMLNKFFSIKYLKFYVVFGMLLSFLFSVIATYKWPSASYYLLPTRAWEMLIGGVAYLYPVTAGSRQKRALELVGIGLILFSYFSVSSDIMWPGYMALIPVMGTFFIIIANQKNSLFTSNFIFQKLGLWSYSIYLWHWPLVVAITYYSLSGLYVYLGIAFSVLLGFISYKYIESVRFYSPDFHIFKSKPVLMSVVFSIVGVGIYISNGLDFRLPEELKKRSRSAISASNDWEYPKPNMRVGSSDVRFIKGNSDKNILFVGASHIEQTYPYVEKLKSNYNIYYLTQGGCFITPSSTHPRSSCENIQNYSDIINNIDFDRIVSSFYLFGTRLSDDKTIMEKQINVRIKEYNDFLKLAKNRAKKVFVILGEPIGDNFSPVKSIRYNLDSFITKEEARSNYKVHNDALSKINLDGNVTVIDPIEYLCDEICMVMDDSSNYYYKDGTHMRPWYAREYLNYLDVIFE